MTKNLGKNKSKNVNGKYSQKRLDHAKESARNALKTSQEKNSKTTGDLTDNKIADKNTKAPKISLQNTLKTVESDYIEGKYLGKDIYLWKKNRILLMI